MTKRKSFSKEKRLAQRLTVSVSVNYRNKGKVRWVKCECVDISGLGLRIISKQAFTPGDQMEIVISDNTQRKVVCESTAKVIWSQVSKKGAFQIGLKLDRVKNIDVFMEFISGCMLDSFFKE